MIRYSWPLLLLCALNTAVAGPRQTIETFQDTLLGSADVADAGFDTRYERLEPVVRQTHDLDYIARLTLGRSWTTLSAGEQTEFAARFARLAVASYAARFDRLDGARFEIVGEQPQPRGVVLVTARLHRSDGEPLAFDYLLRETDAGWRIVNILVDGISDLALKRSEYATLLRDGSVDELLDRLDEQYSRLRQ